MRSRTILAALPGALLLALVSGCSGHFYKEAPTGPTARMRFVANTGGVATACTSSDEGIILGAIGGYPDGVLGIPPATRATGNTLEMIGYPKSAAFAPIERVVKADGEFSFIFGGGGGISTAPGGGWLIRSCRVPLRFRPQPGGQYEAVFEYAHLEGRCGVAVFRLERQGDQVTRVREPTTPGPVCVGS